MTNFSYFNDDKGTLSIDGAVRITTGLSILSEAIRANNFEKGWREDGKPKREVSELVALLHSEVTEAFEADRNHEPVIWYEYNTPGFVGEEPFSSRPMLEDGTLGKPQGITSELADVIIRVFDMADELNLPLIETILEKHAFNQTRQYRHGNKKV